MDDVEWERRERATCARKLRWSRREAAADYAASPLAQGFAYTPLYVYHCRWCFGWHLTSQAQNERTA